MKRLLSLLILLFMVVSFLLPFSDINNRQKEEHDVIEPRVLSDITYEIDIEEIIEEPDQYGVILQEMQTKMSEIESIEDKKEWFLVYKDIVYEYVDWFGLPMTIFDEFSEEEVRLICRVVETETYQCDFDSKVNVANVVLNRIESGDFGDTVEEVVTTENQFAYSREIITEDTILAVMYAYEVIDTTNGALYFHSNEKTDTFCGRSYIFSDDAVHHFY